MKVKTYGFDNARFFVNKSKEGKESGWEGWAKITATGRREYLSGIDPNRSALIVVDMQKACCGPWPKLIAKYNKELADNFNRQFQGVVIPNVSTLLKFFRKQDMLIVFLTLDF